MATVYLARDTRHHRAVAVKILRAEVAASLGPQRFLREIEIAARLTHPHILPLHDSGEAGGLLYYVMPFVEGESLRDRLGREGRLRPDEARRIAREVADALAYAHSQGVVHRDIKPANILLEAGHAVVADFGIARALSEAGGEDLTTSGLAIGTPMYMSPEQISGARVDGRSDLYSLGCVLHEMVTGEPPFKGPSATAVAARQLYEDPPLLASLSAVVPPDIGAAIDKALAKSPSDRFKDAGEFAEALSTSGTRTAVASHAGRAGRRWGVGITLAALAPALFMLWRSTAGARDLKQPNWLIVADLEGPADDRNLTGVVRELVTTELDQSTHVTPMPRELLKAAFRDAGLPDTSHLTTDVARELAVRSSVRAVLSGSVRPLGSRRYALVLRVTDAESGNTVMSVSGEAADSNLVLRVQDLARQVRRGLGERRGAIEANKPLVQVATPSFEAYRKYVSAVDLAKKADFAGSNRLAREALALDTAFAAAWVLMNSNYSNARFPDSMRMALTRALRHPERLRDLQRYRLEADAAYAIRYDPADAVRWFDLYLRQDPQNGSSHNERGTYLYALGRYEEALRDFEQATKLQKFDLQIPLFNQVSTLLALGREDDARSVTRRLTGSFLDCATLLLLTARAEWPAAESVATVLTGSPSTPPWLKAQAITVMAGAMASNGGVAASYRLLQQAARNGEQPGAHWYMHAQLLLGMASGHPVGSPERSVIADTTPGGLLIGGIWLAMGGDTARAHRRLHKLRELDDVELRRLGGGPALLEAWIEARRARWDHVIRVLGPAAFRGEHDGADPNQVSSSAMRWLVANAYEKAGRLDSAAAYFEMVAQSTRIPFWHLLLRGLTYSHALRRLAQLQQNHQ
jgi:serine/threonine-protein kinase